jgi:hypothetical protein
MAALFDKVIIWGEKLIYQGTKDDSLPPDVIKALDAYLAESNSKLLVVLPLKDEREKESKKPPRSGLMMECFDPAVSPEQLVARLEVVGRHATSALYNAAEHRRIPMRVIWQPIAKVQEGLGGKARAITYAIVAGLALLIGIMVLVPYPLKMDAKGQLLPIERRYIFSPVDGKIEEFKVRPSQDVFEGDDLVEMFDVEQQRNMIRLQSEALAAQNDAIALGFELQKAEEKDKLRISADKLAKEHTRELKLQELKSIQERIHSVPGKFGHFMLKAPITGTVLNGSFVEELTNRTVKPNEPVLRIGNKEGDWEIELKIPQKHIGQILQAFPRDDPEGKLDVDIILRSAPTRTFKGKLVRKNVGGEATPNRDDNNEAEPVVVAYVQISGEGIDPKDSMAQDKNLLVTGSEVVAKVRCGNHPLGYSLFYGVWEFFYEKVVFFF